MWMLTSKFYTRWNLSNQRLQRLVEECGVTWTDAGMSFFLKSLSSHKFT